MTLKCNGCGSRVNKTENRVQGAAVEINGVTVQNSWIASETYECSSKCPDFTAGPVGKIGWSIVG